MGNRGMEGRGGGKRPAAHLSASRSRNGHWVRLAAVEKVCHELN